MTHGPMFCLANPETSIYVGDCRDVLKNIPPNTFDLIFADPPFNIGEKYGGWNDNLSWRDYLDFTAAWLDACLRVLGPRGAFWINVPDSIVAEIVIHLKRRDLVLINWCIWHYRFGQNVASKFINSKEHVLYFAKDATQRTFNGYAIAEPSDRQTTYGDERALAVGRVPLDVWYGKFWGRVQGTNVERRHKHQNQLPEIYLDRVLKACSNYGDMVLDPFTGSGTTLTVARNLGRRSVGIEISPTLAESAFERIQKGPVHV